MVVFELHNAKNYCLGSRVAPQTLVPLYSIGQQRCLPGMVVFKMHRAKKQLGSGVTPQTPIAVYSTGQQKVFLDT